MFPIDVAKPGNPVSRANSLDLPNGVLSSPEDSSFNTLISSSPATTSRLHTGLPETVASRCITPVSIGGVREKELDISETSSLIKIPVSFPVPANHSVEPPELQIDGQSIHFTNDISISMLPIASGTITSCSVESSGHGIASNIQSPGKIDIPAHSQCLDHLPSAVGMTMTTIPKTIDSDWIEESMDSSTATQHTTSITIGDTDSSEKITRELGKALANFEQGENIEMVLLNSCLLLFFTCCL